MNPTFRHERLIENSVSLLRTISLVLLGVVLAGCPAGRTVTEKKVVICGSNTFGEELGPRLIALYKKEHPAVTFETGFKATGYGVGALLADQCDIAAASRVLNANEREAARSRFVLVGCAKGAATESGPSDASVADGTAEPGAEGGAASDAPGGGDEASTTSDGGCNSANCPTGCCNNDVCVTGTDDSACGNAGSNCLNCTTHNQACKAFACVAANCVGCTTGCCMGSSCEPGQSDQACGSHGATCMDCSANSLACVNGLCTQ